eukprot:m.187902 g.187902  ORF g.187902 m.187902 type:complete len:675 (-) comp32321_c1_seq1:56-2080(-)
MSGYQSPQSRKKIFPHGRATYKIKDDTFLEKVVSVLEILFGDAHWTANEMFRSLADQKGWIQLVRLVQVPELAQLFTRGNSAIQTIHHAMKQHPSKLIQVHRNGACLRRYPLNHRVRSHFEFLFGDDNFFRDLELQFLTQESDFVPVQKLLNRRELSEMLSPAFTDMQKAIQGIEAALSDSVLLELSDLGTPELSVRRRSLAARVVRQVEFYLSREHLQHDGYLNELMAESQEGWIRLSDMLAFPRMKTLCLPQVDAVARVLKEQSLAVETGANFTIRPLWYAKEHGLNSDNADLAEPNIDIQPPLSPMLPWYPAKINSDFRVMTWNLLADFLCNTGLFPYCKPGNLNWYYRKSLILSEIARNNPSIVCLQELQGIGPGGPERCDHFNQLRAELEPFGYEGVYIRKAQSGSAANLGNAVFWMKDTFTCEKRMQISYRDAIGMRCTTDASRWYFGGGTQVALVVFLKHIGLKTTIAVVTTHITSAWETPAKQICQIQELLVQLDVAIPKDIPLVLAGDFNSLPGSGAYRLITEGQLSVNDPHAMVSREDMMCGISLPYPNLAHQIVLESAYKKIYGGEPMFTNFTSEPVSFSGTLDYIFYTEKTLDVACVMPLPSFDACRKEVALPNSIYPSDHLPLTACFSFKKSITSPRASNRKNKSASPLARKVNMKNLDLT